MIQVRHQCMEGDVRVGEAEEKHVSGSKQEKENCDEHNILTGLSH